VISIGGQITRILHVTSRVLSSKAAFADDSCTIWKMRFSVNHINGQANK